MRLSDAIDRDALKKAFAVDQRIQISNFLDTDSAKSLFDAYSEIPWRLVLNEGEQHFDIAPEQLSALSSEKLKLLTDGARERSRSQFQYMYKNYPVADIATGAGLPSGPIKGMYEFMNSDNVLDLLNELTGLKAEFCDMQATRYETGHFLTAHDDNVASKNRKFAYVLSLNPDWKSGWGGLLQFLKSRSSSSVQKSFVPSFNTLSLFQVPVLHRVSIVEPHASAARLSLTGWYRTH